jgi:DNA polymerase-3 subunit gamma/tau
MSYLVLARKWRPRTFAELIGQEHVVQALANALRTGRLHHAWLLTGTRGVGKTTLARILAKCLNCEAGVTAEPCGKCPACREIEGGRFVDLLEIDAASNTQVEHMRELLENAQYAPTSGRYKVYIIDEVHMLSRHAFNAMLKTLEEPPEHVKFILATTDPQKVPVTVLSRCLQFNLKQMPPALVSEHLARILEKEGVAGEPQALRMLGRAAGGSMRDGLSLLDQAIAHGGGEVKAEAVADMLGILDQDYVFRLLEALADGDGAALMAEAEALQSRGMAFDAALQQLASMLHLTAIAQSVPEALPEDDAPRERLLALAPRFDPEDTQLHYQIALNARRDLHLAPDAFAGFTMALLRMLAFTVGDGALRTGGGEPGPGDKTEKAGSGSNAQTPSTGEPRSVARGPRSLSTDASSWPRLVEGLKLSGAVRQLALNCELAEHTREAFVLRVAEAHKNMLESFGARLISALEKHLGQGTKVRIELGTVSGATPAALARQSQDRRQAEAEASIRDDPFVATMVEEFGATVSNIRPMDETRGES